MLKEDIELMALYVFDIGRSPTEDCLDHSPLREAEIYLRVRMRREDQGR